MRQGESVSVEFSQYNNTSSNVPAVIERYFGGQSLFKSTKNISMIISKFNLPISSQEIIRITDNTDYNITLETLFQQVSGTKSSPAKLSQSASFFTRDYFKIYTPSDYIEQINRCIYESYVNLCMSVDSSGLANPFYRTVTSSTSFSSATATRNLVVNTLSGTKCVYTKLIISDVVNNTLSATDDMLVNIYLTSPTGTKILVASGLQLEPSKTYNFSDINVGQQSKYLGVLSANSGSTTCSYKPIELFNTKYYDEDAEGTWVVEIRPCGNNELDLNCSLSLLVCNAPVVTNEYEWSSLPGYYTVDKTTGILSLHCPEKWIKSAILIKPSSKLKSILSLKKESITNYVEIPSTIISSTATSIITFQANSPKVYLMNQLAKILIESPSMNINRDLSSTANVSSNIVSSFDLSSDEVLNFDYVSFVYNGPSPIRKFEFLSDTEFSSIYLLFKVQYYNGDVYNVELEPQQLLSGLLTFVQE